MPVAPLRECGLRPEQAVLRPRDDVLHRRRDLLQAPRASVRLLRARHGPYPPTPVSGRLDALQPPSGAFQVERRVLLAPRTTSGAAGAGHGSSLRYESVGAISTGGIVPVRMSSRYQNAESFQLLSLIHLSEPTRLGMNSYAVFC